MIGRSLGCQRPRLGSLWVDGKEQAAPQADIRVLSMPNDRAHVVWGR
jgi:hypothetical protein